MSVPYLHEVYGAGAPTRQGLKHPSIAPYGSYITRDGKEVVISVQNEREWQQFCEVFLRQPSMAKDARYVSNTDRVKHRHQLDAEISAAFGQLGIDEVLTRLGESRTAYGQVRSVADMAVHPALRTWPMPVGDGCIDMVAPPVRAPWDAERFQAAPTLGQHSAALRAEFGVTDRRIAA